MLHPLLLTALLACADKGDDTGPGAGTSQVDSGPCGDAVAGNVTWAVTATPTETTCGVDPGQPWTSYYGVEYTLLGFELLTCDGLDADGVIAGCEWTYTIEALYSRPTVLPEGGVWSLEAAGYAWDKPQTICSLPDGVDWQTTEVMTLEDPGATGLPQDCTWTVQVEGRVY